MSICTYGFLESLSFQFILSLSQVSVWNPGLPWLTVASSSQFLKQQPAKPSFACNPRLLCRSELVPNSGIRVLSLPVLGFLV